MRHGSYDRMPILSPVSDRCGDLSYGRQVNRAAFSSHHRLVLAAHRRQRVNPAREDRSFERDFEIVRIEYAQPSVLATNQESSTVRRPRQRARRASPATTLGRVIAGCLRPRLAYTRASSCGSCNAFGRLHSQGLATHASALTADRAVSALDEEQL